MDWQDELTRRIQQRLATAVKKERKAAKAKLIEMTKKETAA
jgi:hypothetical protein